LWEVYKSTRDATLLAYILEQFDYFDEHFYRYFFDEADGLYRGQATFIDVAGPCYPGRGPGKTVILKALSTNCLYAGCFSILQKVASLAGKSERADAFGQRRDRLAESIRKSFGVHGYPFYKDEDGNFSDRREILGTAFLAIFDILPRDESASLLASYHEGDYGRPLVWPFYGSKQIYHDNSTWPFADTIFALAEYKVGNRSEVIRATLGKLCRAALSGNFNEVLEYATGKFVGCPGYIWSAASYLAVIFKMIAGMVVDENGRVTFAPVLPAQLGDRLDLDGLKIGEMTVNLRIRGNGERVERCTVDGEDVDCPSLDVAAGEHVVEIHLGDGAER
jgi:glycogen debranching enzyme